LCFVLLKTAAAQSKNDSIKRAVYDIIVEVSAVLPLATLDLLCVRVFMCTPAPHSPTPVRRGHHLLTCSHAHMLTCSPAHLLTCSPAHLLTCSPAHLLTCSPAHLLALSCVCTCLRRVLRRPCRWSRIAGMDIETFDQVTVDMVRQFTENALYIASVQGKAVEVRVAHRQWEWPVERVDEAASGAWCTPSLPFLRVFLLLLDFESPCAACPQGEAPPPPRRYGLDLFWSVITSAPGRLPAEVVTMAQAAFVEVFKSKHFPTEVRGGLAAWLVARVSKWVVRHPPLVTCADLGCDVPACRSCCPTSSASAWRA
jgi:hypothetical protein